MLFTTKNLIISLLILTQSIALWQSSVGNWVQFNTTDNYPLVLSQTLLNPIHHHTRLVLNESKSEESESDCHHVTCCQECQNCNYCGHIGLISTPIYIQFTPESLHLATLLIYFFLLLNKLFKPPR